MAAAAASLIFLSCRRASEGIQPGCKAGYRCKLCEIALQVTPTGQEQIAHVGLSRIMMLCNSCALDLMDRLKKRDTEVNIVVSPEATAQIEREEGKCALDVFPKATVSFDPLEFFRDPKPKRKL